MKTHIKSADGRIVRSSMSIYSPDDMENLHDTWFSSPENEIQFPQIWTIGPETLRKRREQGSIYMKLEADGAIQGLATFSPNAKNFDGEHELYIGFLEKAPWNKKGGPKAYKSITGAILEVAVRESMRLGAKGRVGLAASAPHLIPIYEHYGMRLVSADYGYMIFDVKSAKDFIRKMEADRED